MSTTQSTVAPPAPPAPVRPRWTTGRVVGLSLASAAVLAAGAMAAGAGFIHLVDEERRQGDYLTTDTVRVSSPGHAVAVEEIDLDGLSGDWLLGTARLRATSETGGSVFVGVAPEDEVEDYLEGVDHSVVSDFDGGPRYEQHDGGPPGSAPGNVDIWEAQASGPGTQTVTWKPRGGDWAVVVMQQDAAAGVDVRADVGATAPVLQDAVCVLTVAAVVTGSTGLLGLLLVLLSVRRRGAVAR